MPTLRWEKVHDENGQPAYVARDSGTGRSWNLSRWGGSWWRLHDSGGRPFAAPTLGECKAEAHRRYRRAQAPTP